jgi:hypothetical protein
LEDIRKLKKILSVVQEHDVSVEYESMSFSRGGRARAIGERNRMIPFMVGKVE